MKNIGFSPPRLPGFSRPAPCAVKWDKKGDKAEKAFLLKEKAKQKKRKP